MKASGTALLMAGVIAAAGCADGLTGPTTETGTTFKASGGSAHDLNPLNEPVDPSWTYVSHWDGNSGTCNGGGGVYKFELRMTGVNADGTPAAAVNFNLDPVYLERPLWKTFQFVPHEHTRESVNTEVYCQTTVLGFFQASRVGTYQFFYDTQGKWQTLCNRICATWAMDWVPRFYTRLAYATASVNSLTLTAGQSTSVIGHAYAYSDDGTKTVEVFNGAGGYGSRRGYISVGTPTAIASSFGDRWRNVTNTVTGNLAGLDTLIVSVRTERSESSVSAFVPVTVRPSANNLTGPTSIAIGSYGDYSVTVGGCNPTCTYYWYMDTNSGRVDLNPSDPTASSVRVNSWDANDASFRIAVVVSSNGQSSAALGKAVSVYSPSTGGGGGGGGGGGCLMAIAIDPGTCKASTVPLGKSKTVNAMTAVGSTTTRTAP